MKKIVEFPDGFRLVDGTYASGEFKEGSDRYNELVAKGLKPERLPQSAKDEYQAQQAKDKINQNAQSYLASTDWIIVRSFDTDAEVPEDIRVKRQEARDQIK